MMSEDYRSMWADLGLDLEAHDALLDVLGKAYQDIYLSQKDLNISSTCTVFAESEVTSLIARGQNRREIARGLHTSVIRRAAGMINRVSSEGNIVFTGGMAKNPCMRALLEEKLGRRILSPQDPQLVGALGAALLAGE
jgi:activator of 2-hydroxyglutaryl-CoA dehydratase